MKFKSFFISVLLCISLFISPANVSAQFLPTILLSDYDLELNLGEEYSIFSISSDNRIPIYTSTNSNVASVDKNGKITAKKAGECQIIASIASSQAVCNVIVKKTTIKLNKLYTRLYRYQSTQLTATVSSKVAPKWNSSKKSVAIVNENGKVTALKHGTTLITVTADGTTKVCEVVVESPEINLEYDNLTMYENQIKNIDMTISSGNAPKWSSSNPKVVCVDQLGNVRAKKAGSATITVSEDGSRAKCKIRVIASR